MESLHTKGNADIQNQTYQDADDSLCSNSYELNLDIKKDSSEVFIDCENCTFIEENCLETSDSKNIVNKSKLLDGRFKKEKLLGFGAYGKVYLALNQEGNKFAIKKYYFDKYKNSKTIIMDQIKILKNLKHISLPDIFYHFTHKENDFLALDYYPLDLLSIIKNNPWTNSNETQSFFKAIIYLLFNSISYLHENSVIHRDLKPDNIMISFDGNIKIIDFDLTKVLKSPNDKLTKGVGTLYYKPAEVFFGEMQYGYSLDLWALGCILAEIFLGKPLFESQNELGVLSKIANILGAPNEENFPGVSNLSTFISFNCPNEILFNDIFKECPKDLKVIILQLLSLNPKNRTSVSELLKENYFENMKESLCSKMIKEFLQL